MNYNEKNTHPRDCRIHFDAGTHVYTVDTETGGSMLCDSVTTVVDSFFEQFDADYWAERKATPGHTAEQIKAEWAAKGEAARRLGTELHDRIERHYFGEEPSADALADKAFGHFLNFARRVHLQPYRSEWRIFSEKYALAGTLDFLACDIDGVFEIYDWKRSSKLVGADGKVICDDCYGKYAGHPVEHLPDTTFYHYALQVSLYRYILETEYGIGVAGGRLGTFHPDYDRPYIIDLPYLRDEVMAILKTRRR